jgi:hypothetical protein
MSKRAAVKPEWLDAILLSWGRARVPGVLGFPSESFMFKERVPTPARSYEPTGFCAIDYSELEAAIQRLDRKHQLVLVRCYKPWTSLVIEDELRKYYTVGERTWCNWLHEAASLVSTDMLRAEDARMLA